MSGAAEEEHEWDAFVRTADRWTPYHLSCFPAILRDVHGHSSILLRARGPSGALRGVLPLTEVRSRLFGHFLVSMPFLNYGGPLGDAEAQKALVAAAVELADELRVDLLELRAQAELRTGLEVSHRKVTVLLDLPEGDMAPLWDGLKSKVRSQIRRPMKEGVDVRFGPGEIEGFYAVFAQHMRDLGTPVQPRRLFLRMQEELGDAMWFGCAYLDGRPVAAGSGFRWAHRFELVWASALREFSPIAPNMLLYWRFLERCIEDGASVFDFGRCSPGGGTHRFKKQWGGRDAKLWWYQHGTAVGSGTPSPDSGLYTHAVKVWRRLPLVVTNALGPRIVRFIP